MSQADKIYDYLTRTRNQAADMALLIALHHSADPYQSVILEGILDRGRPAATCDLVRAYHEFSPQWQKLLLDRVDTLYGGLRLAARSSQEQTRLNCLNIIRCSGYRRITDVVVTLLRDTAASVAQLAADTLLEVTRSSVRAQMKSSPEQIRIFRSALQLAVRNYRVHRRGEAVMAAMMAVPADDSSFWQDELKTYYNVGKTIRYILLQYDRPEIAPFCVSALRHPDLYMTAVRAISHHQNPAYLAAIAAQARLQRQPPPARVWKLIKKPRWLRPEIFTPGYIETAALPDLISLVAALGAPDGQKADCLLEAAANPDPAIARRVVKAMAHADDSVALEFFRNTARLSCESVVLMSLIQLIRRNHPHLPALLGEHLNSPWPRVLKLARRYYQNIAFTCYWEKFDVLDQEHRRQAGRAVYKIDPEARLRWKKIVGDPSPLQRLKAVRMVRSLGQAGDCVSELIRLARDEDRMVRSCAVAALGEIDAASSPSVESCLFAALRDTDVRVQANAVEALEHRQDRQTIERISPFVHSPNNRARANAIRALLIAKIDSARQAIQQMLRDPRPAHRLSARWILEHTDVERSPAPRRKEDRHALAV